MKRNNRINVLVSSTEKEKLIRIAKAHNLNITGLVRAISNEEIGLMDKNSVDNLKKLLKITK
jgi:hypothetical protein